MPLNEVTWTYVDAEVSTDPNKDHGYIEGLVASPPPYPYADIEVTIKWSDHEHMFKTWMRSGSGYSGDNEVTTCMICSWFARMPTEEDERYSNIEDRHHPETCKCGSYHQRY